MELKNKKAIVIGGSKGIGAKIAKELKKLKIKTLACSRKEIDTSSLESVIKLIKNTNKKVIFNFIKNFSI